MLSNTSLSWNQILKTDEWNTVTPEDFNDLLSSNTLESQSIIGQFYLKNPEMFGALFDKLPLSYKIVNNALESTNITFYKSLCASPKFKSFVSNNLDTPNSVLKMLTIIMVDQATLNQVVEWIGKESFQDLLQFPNTSVFLKDLLSSYYIAQNTVGVNSWSNPKNKTSAEDIETMYLVISDRLTTDFNFLDLKSLMFLSSMANVKNLMVNNFSQFHKLFKSALDKKQYDILNILYKIMNNLVFIPKPKSEQDIKMIQMKLMSMGVDQDIAFDPNVIAEEETLNEIELRISHLIDEYDVCFYYSSVYSLINMSEKSRLLFVDALTHLTTPVSTRRKLVAGGLLKMLLTIRSKDAIKKLQITLNIARLLTSTNPAGICKKNEELVVFVPMMYELLKAGNDYEYQLQGIMALTNLCCVGEQSVFNKIYECAPVTFTTFLSTYMTHDVKELRRVGMELFTNMIQSDLIESLYFDEERCLYENIRLAWLFAFEEDKYLQYAALGALAYLTYAPHIKKYILRREKVNEELLEMVEFKQEMEQSHLAVVAILGNMIEDMSVELKDKLYQQIDVEINSFKGNTKLAALELQDMLKE